MPRKTKTTAAADNTAQPQFSAELLGKLIPGPVTPSWASTWQCRSPSAASCTPSRSCPSAGRLSEASRGWRRTAGHGKTASVGSTPACSSSTWRFWLCYSGDRKHALSACQCRCRQWFDLANECFGFLLRSPQC